MSVSNIAIAAGALSMNWRNRASLSRRVVSARLRAVASRMMVVIWVRPSMSKLLTDASAGNVDPSLQVARRSDGFVPGAADRGDGPALSAASGDVPGADSRMAEIVSNQLFIAVVAKHPQHCRVDVPDRSVCVGDDDAIRRGVQHRFKMHPAGAQIDLDPVHSCHIGKRLFRRSSGLRRGVGATPCGLRRIFRHRRAFVAGVRRSNLFRGAVRPGSRRRDRTEAVRSRRSDDWPMTCSAVQP